MAIKMWVNSNGSLGCVAFTRVVVVVVVLLPVEGRVVEGWMGEAGGGSERGAIVVGVEQLAAVQRGGVESSGVRGSMAVVVGDVVRRSSRRKAGGVRHSVYRWQSEELTVCG
jgi:hypothetical protein